MRLTKVEISCIDLRTIYICFISIQEKVKMHWP